MLKLFSVTLLTVTSCTVDPGTRVRGVTIGTRGPSPAKVKPETVAGVAVPPTGVIWIMPNFMFPAVKATSTWSAVSTFLVCTDPYERTKTHRHRYWGCLHFSSDTAQKS